MSSLSMWNRKSLGAWETYSRTMALDKGAIGLQRFHIGSIDQVISKVNVYGEWEIGITESVIGDHENASRTRKTILRQPLDLNPKTLDDKTLDDIIRNQGESGFSDYTFWHVAKYPYGDTGIDIVLNQEGLYYVRHTDQPYLPRFMASYGEDGDITFVGLMPEILFAKPEQKLDIDETIQLIGQYIAEDKSDVPKNIKERMKRIAEIMKLSDDEDRLGALFPDYRAKNREERITELVNNYNAFPSDGLPSASESDLRSKAEKLYDYIDLIAALYISNSLRGSRKIKDLDDKDKEKLSQVLTTHLASRMSDNDTFMIYLMICIIREGIDSKIEIAKMLGERADAELKDMTKKIILTHRDIMDYPPMLYVDVRNGSIVSIPIYDINSVSKPHFSLSHGEGVLIRQVNLSDIRYESVRYAVTMKDGVIEISAQKNMPNSNSFSYVNIIIPRRMDKDAVSGMKSRDPATWLTSFTDSSAKFSVSLK